MQTDKELIDLIDEYIEYLDLKDITKTSYKKVLIDFNKYTRYKRKSFKPLRVDLLAYKSDLRKRVKSASVQRNIVVIRNFYRWISVHNYGDNIAEGIKGAKIEATFKREPLTEKEAVKLLLKAYRLSSRGIDGIRDYALVSLLLTTGLRTIEIERADRSDLDFINETNVLFIQGKGRDDKDSYVKLSEEVFSQLEEYLIKRNDNFEPLFITHANRSKGTRLRTRSIRGIVKELLRLIGLDSKVYSAHSLRHSCATINLNNGGSLEETQQMLRHKDISTTTIYSHHLTRTQNNSEIRVSSILFDTVNKKIKRQEER